MPAKAEALPTNQLDVLHVLPRIVLSMPSVRRRAGRQTSAPAVFEAPGGVVKPFEEVRRGHSTPPVRRIPLDPQSEAHELRDIGAADTSPTLGSDTTWNDVDRMWAAEMERRDREAACPEGHRHGACEACGCELYVPVGQGGDVLCDGCRIAGEALAADDATDDGGGGPRPPAAGAMYPDYPQFAALAATLLDDQLCEAISVADDEPATFRLVNDVQRQAFIAAMSAEVVRRLEGRRAA